MLVGAAIGRPYKKFKRFAAFFVGCDVLGAP